MRKMNLVATFLLSLAMLFFYQSIMSYQQLYNLSDGFVIEIAHRGFIDEKIKKRGDSLGISMTCLGANQASIGDLLHVQFSKPFSNLYGPLSLWKIEITRTIMIGYAY